LTSLSQTIENAYKGSWNSLVNQLIHPFSEGISSFYVLIFLSLAIWTIEICLPWRKNQSILRKDFWLDAFYMFFNYYLFGLIIFAALSNTTSVLFSELMGSIGMPRRYIFDFFHYFPVWLQVIIFFMVRDFLQWCIHNLLHRIPFLWRFHKLHHSVREMGFAAHLRYHFMENVVYQLIGFVVLSYILHFKLEYGFYVYMIGTLIGHLNHANLGWDFGPLRYILNNPKMHIWHHVKDLPKDHRKGVNFAISLSCWDYLFKTNYIPFDGRDIELGFEGVENYPSNFFEQQIEPFKFN